MKALLLFGALAAAVVSTSAGDARTFETDVIPASGGDLELTFIGHGTLMFNYNDLIIHIDPVARYADYAALPKADIILITHEHGDHLDAATVKLLSKKTTALVTSAVCAEKLGYGTVLANGEETDVNGIHIAAVPAYNLKHMRSPGTPYHPKGRGNGFVLTFGDKTVYVAGDTENIPEMQKLKGVDIAFLPMNLPYTMDLEMAADAVRMLGPGIVYPYHYGETDVEKLLPLLGDDHPEVRIRALK